MNPTQNGILISEIFGPTIQGEGSLSGQPSIFVRTGGCDYRCSWCDTLYAVDTDFRDSWVRMEVDEIWKHIQQLSEDSPMLVTLTGGNPAIHNFGDLIQIGQDHWYRFALETQGSVPRSWFCDLDYLVLSPKPPSSNMEVNWQALDSCLDLAGDKPEISIKVVVFDDRDFRFARDLSNRYPHLPFYLQPGNPLEEQQQDCIDHTAHAIRLERLASKVLTEQWHDVKVLPQLHVLMWGNRPGF